MKNIDTYYALSTPRGISATATVRISGPEAINTISTITNKTNDYFLNKKSFVLDLFNKNNSLIDKCVVVCYRKPRSYTGENMVEIHTHGNPTIIKNLFNCLSAHGLRIATPGEFTRTAYKNNKIDLVQAESVFNLINSQTSGGIDLSLNNLGGVLSKEFSSIKKRLIRTLSLIEYELDISETDNIKKTKTTVFNDLKNSQKRINKLIKTHKTASVISDGSRVVLAGETNVGKSTLFNTLLNHERSIVTHLPGTTRDVIESSLTTGGFSIVIVDTAGIRKTKNPVEAVGVKKTILELNSADLIVSIVDSLSSIGKTKTPKNTPVIFVYNKTDLLSKKELISVYKNKKINCFISAKTKKGVKELLRLIEKTLEQNLPKTEGFYITTQRQKEVLVSIKKILKTLTGFKTFDLEVFALEIKTAIDQFDWLLGKTTPDTVLDEVFSLFCVGK